MRHGSITALYDSLRQALAAAMRVFLQELDTLVAQLEALDARTPEGLSLQRLWFYLQPARQTFQMLEHVAISCSNLTGGALLDAVSRCEATGDMEGREVVRFLLSRCARPFFSSLERWLFCGEIIDASGEFLVRGVLLWLPSTVGDISGPAASGNGACHRGKRGSS